MFFTPTAFYKASDPPCNLYTIGQTALGGKIAYILQPEDPGFEAGVCHGLVASTSDISTGIQWGCFGLSIPGADGLAIGTGKQNTTAIIANCLTVNIAARLCSDYSVTVDGTTYEDWFLPSRFELNELYKNRVAIGGFAPQNYWASTTTSLLYNDGFYQSFSAGFMSSNFRNISYYVRAVRYF